jgi:hypothetical protein
MNFQLIQHSYKIAETEFDCEACQMFWAMREAQTMDYRGIGMKDILLFYKSKSGKVKAGQRYLLLVFVNEWGEPLEFRALETMHRFIFSMGFYPEYMLEPMIAYRRQKRIEKADKLVKQL